MFINKFIWIRAKSLINWLRAKVLYIISVSYEIRVELTRTVELALDVSCMDVCYLLQSWQLYLDFLVKIKSNCKFAIIKPVNRFPCGMKISIAWQRDLCEMFMYFCQIRKGVAQFNYTNCPNCAIFRCHTSGWVQYKGIAPLNCLLPPKCIPSSRIWLG